MHNRCFSLRSLALTPLFLLLTSPLSAKDEWPQFRGPAGQGHATAAKLPTTWSETENIAWKTALPGRGWSSPVISGNEIWLTTAVETPISEAEKQERLKANTGNQPLIVSGPLSLRALCVERQTGKLLHDVELLVEPRPQPAHAMNSFASPTPVLETGRLYCHFGSYGTACLDTATQQVVWTSRDLQLQHENGPGSSPVLWGDMLIVHCDGSDVQYIVALDKRTGKIAWKTDRSGKMNDDPQLKKAYGTPLVVEVAGRPEVLSPASDWLYAYDPATGKELWKLNYGVLGFSIVPRPVMGNGMFYMCTSFMQSEVLAIKLDGTAEPSIAWRYARQAPRMPSPLLVGGELYLLSDGGIATCLDAQTGKVLWTQRLKGNFCSSPLLADGKIFCCNRDGETTVIAPGASYSELAVNKLDGTIMASPAALESALYLRTDKALYRIEESAQQACVADEPIRHSFFIAGPTFTGIIDEDGNEAWDAGRVAARDGFVLPSGNLLIAWTNEVLELTREKQTVFRYALSPENKEIGAAERLDNGNTLITELGPQPRLREVNAEGKVVVDFALQPETDNAHMQTRMARKLASGNYLVPHLLAFQVKEYSPAGEVLAKISTDISDLGGRARESWPFTAIRLPDGNTLVNLTHGNQTVEFDSAGKVVWKVGNEDFPDLTADQKPFADPCGGQRLPNGNTVIASYAATGPTKVFEVTRDKRIVWQYTGKHRAHEIQVLTTNGQSLEGKPLK